MAKRIRLALLEAAERTLEQVIVDGASPEEIATAYDAECRASERFERAETGRQRALATKIGRSVGFTYRLNSARAWEEAQQAIRHPIPCAEARRGKNSGITQCQHGHEFTVENTAWQSAGKGKGKQRRCRQCMRDKQAIRPIRPEVLALIRGEK